jgi:hypothetical protein
MWMRGARPAAGCTRYVGAFLDVRDLRAGLDAGSCAAGRSPGGARPRRPLRFRSHHAAEPGPAILVRLRLDRPICDHPAHLAVMLQQAGLLAPVADRRTPTQLLADTIRAGTDDPILLARVDQMLHRAGLLKEDE